MVFNVVLEILALNIQRLVSYSESRIKLTKQKLFSADCFCSFLHKFQIFWRETVHHPILWHYLVYVLTLLTIILILRLILIMGVNNTISIIKTNFDSWQRTQSSLSNSKQSFRAHCQFSISHS